MNSLATDSTVDTLAGLVERLGKIPLERIRYRPYPGTATEEDVIRVEAQENRLCELVEGVLVEKAMGFRESLLAMAIGNHLRDSVNPGNRGIVVGADGMMRLFAGLVRIPDVAFVSWDRLPGGKVPDEPIPQVAPDLAVEVLSPTNTPAEMQRKREEYFQAGSTLVWIVDPDKRTVTVYTSPDDSVEHSQGDTLTGGTVLPGFVLPLDDLFAELDRREKEE
jgi:Uma2 family endonuclease